MPEEEKLSGQRADEMKSIEEICTTTWEALYRFIYYKVQNRQEAEDITQETYAKAMKHMQRNHIQKGKYLSFLKAVSLNLLRDSWRKSKRQGKTVDIEAVKPEEAAVKDTVDDSVQRELLISALNELNEEQRRVVELRIMQGYSTAEAAKAMSKKEGAIRVLQYRALQKLAEILKSSDI